jgi:hypothetical protein
LEATVATLHREIEHEERRVGIRPQVAVTESMITRRQVQIAIVLALVVAALLGVAFMPRTSIQTPLMRVFTIALAVLLAVYAVEQDRHLRRLRALAADAQRVTRAVADALAQSGVLRLDNEVLLLRDSFRESADQLANGLADALGADFALVRVPGPAGEMSSRLARHTLRRGTAMFEKVDDDRAVLAVPIWHHGDPVAVFEAVSKPEAPFSPEDADLVDAYACGALAAMRA